MNGWEETESVLMSLVKYFEEKPTGFHEGYLYDTLESELYRYEIDKAILKEEYSSIASENIIEVIDKKKSYFKELLHYLWEKSSEIKELRNLVYKYNENDSLEFEIGKLPEKELEYYKAK